MKNKNKNKKQGVILALLSSVIIVNSMVSVKVQAGSPKASGHILNGKVNRKGIEKKFSASEVFRSAFRDMMPADALTEQKNDLLYPVSSVSRITESPIYTFDSIEDYLIRASREVPTPEHLYQESVGHSTKSLLLKKFKETPLLIIVPGIFAEFIKNHAFQDVIDDSNSFDRQTIATQQYKDLFDQNYFAARVEMPAAQKNLLTDTRLALKDVEFEHLANVQATEVIEGSTSNLNLGHSQKDIRDLVLLGVLKNRDGKVIANTLTLDTAQLSLESLGSLQSNSQTFVRRISKFFSIMGTSPENIIISGYSRGGAIALEMLAQTNKPFDCLPIDTDRTLEEGCIHSARAVDSQHRRWTDNIRAYVSVAGVIYGSELADVVFPRWQRNESDYLQDKENNNTNWLLPLFSIQKPIYLSDSKTYNARKIDALIKLRNSLKFLNEPSEEKSLWTAEPVNHEWCKIPGPWCWFFKEGEMIFANLNDDPKKVKILTENLKAWTEFLVNMAKISAEAALVEGVDAGKQASGQFWKGMDLNKFLSDKPLQFGIDILKEVFDLALKLENEFTMNAKVDVNATLAQGIGLLNEAFGAKNYNSNILRFKILVDETIAAAQDLTTAARLTWWRNHIIPASRIKYYNVAATMSMADRNLIINGMVLRPNETAKAISKFSYNTDSVDFPKLLGSYNSLKDLGELVNNDSQVSLHKSIFHPALITYLNPNQPEFKTEVLGVFHTHHWGLTLKTVTQIKDGALNETVEPYPRKALLEAVISSLATDPEYPLDKLHEKTIPYFKTTGR